MTNDRARPDRGMPIKIWLELDLDAKPIEGSLQTPGGSPSRFIGWLGLTAALEGLHRPRSPGPGEESG